MPSLLVEGWRFLPHSYAVVNQHQLLALLGRPGLALYHRDMPLLADWKPLAGVFDPDDEARLRSIPAPPRGLKPDAVLRMAFPHHFQPSTTGAPTFIFGTTEFQLLEKGAVGGGARPRDVLTSLRSTIIAPSRWAAAGFINSGAPADRVKVIYSGINPDVLRPLDPAPREAARARLGWEGKFVLLNVSAMTPNKGLPLLLRSAAALLPQHPQLHIVLKGSDTIFRSQQMAAHAMAEVSPAEQRTLRARVEYTGGLLTTSRLAELYQCADAYVAPYLAEGFNLPVLEAGACGTAVITTAGGPTDEFSDPSWCLRIDSARQKQPDGRITLQPSQEHLTSLIARVITDPSIAARARESGPRWAQGRYTWRHTADHLLQTLFPGGS
jgi:glycosyltransferase involved in cell wall biosynthesis